MKIGLKIKEEETERKKIKFEGFILTIFKKLKIV